MDMGNRKMHPPYWGYLAIILAAVGYTAVKTQDTDGFIIVLKWLLLDFLIVYSGVILPFLLMNRLSGTHRSRRKITIYQLTPYRIQGFPEEYLEPYLLIAVSVSVPLFVNLFWLYAVTAVPVLICLGILFRRRQYYRECGYRCTGPMLLVIGSFIVSLLIHLIFY